MNWDRLLWGVEFDNPRFSRPIIIGDAWNHDAIGTPYDGEPTRALLFFTRKHARAWCKAKMAQYRDRDDLCKDWKFRVVRVRETVKKVKK